MEGIIGNSDEKIVQKFAVAATMTGFVRFIIGKDLRLAPERLEQNFRGHIFAVTRFIIFAVAESGQVFTDLGKAAFDDIVFQTALAAVEADAVTFIGTMGTEGVVHDHIVFVANHDAHVIFDADTVGENTAVAEITVILFVFKVEFLEKCPLIGDTQSKRIIQRNIPVFGTVVKFGNAAPFSIVSAVELQITHGVDRLGFGVDPPVDQVEVVGGFVNHQSAGIPFVPVPAAEIIRTVVGVEKPFKVDAGDLAANTAVQQFFDPGVTRAVTVVECHSEFFAGTLLGVDDHLALFGIDGHRFFGNDIASEFHGAAGVDLDCLFLRIFSPYLGLVLAGLHRMHMVYRSI